MSQQRSAVQGWPSTEFHLVRLEDGRDRYTVLPDRFTALEEAKAHLEHLKAQQPQHRFVIQLSGLA
jgi:hypothetical protein